MFFDLENNYQNKFGYFLNPLLLFNRDEKGLINDNFNNNMMLLNDNNENTSLQNQKADLPTINNNDNLCLDEQDTKWKTLKENNNFLLPHNQAKPDIDIKDESNKNCFSLEEIKDILKNIQISEKLKKINIFQMLNINYLIKREEEKKIMKKKMKTMI